MHLCMYTCILHVYIHTRIHTYIDIHTHTHTAAVKHLKKLRRLELSSCTRISIEAIRSLASVSGTLESLSQADSTQLIDTELSELSTLTNLKILDLSGCRGVSDATIEAISNSCGNNLEQINLSHTPDSGFKQEPLVCRVTDEGLATLARKCPQLQCITLRCCNTITDQGIKDLALGCRYLRNVDLAKCKSLTDDGIIALAKNCRDLDTLVLDSAGKDSDADEKEKSTTVKHGITDKSLLEIEKFMSKNLVHLDLSWCRLVACFFRNDVV
jgi:hypothetical protein